MKSKMISIRIDEELYRKLQRNAAIEGLSLSDAIRMVLEEWTAATFAPEMKETKEERFAEFEKYVKKLKTYTEEAVNTVERMRQEIALAGEPERKEAQRRTDEGKLEETEE